VKTETKNLLQRDVTGPYLCRMLGRQQKPETGLATPTHNKEKSSEYLLLGGNAKVHSSGNRATDY